MRVAPIAVNYRINMEQLDMEGAQLAAITHGHSLGYMPAAVLVHVINRIVFPPKERKNVPERRSFWKPEIPCRGSLPGIRIFRN